MKLPGFEFRFIAYELVQHHRGRSAGLDVPALEKLGHGMDSWAAVDCFGCYLAGPAWREQQISDSVIRRWTRSKDRWWRRTALVCTVALNNKARGGVGDTRSTLMICRLLVSDRDDMVVKALSWALRELSKRDPGSVRQFLQEHEGRLAPRVVREVNNKLRTGLKNPRKFECRFAFNSEPDQNYTNYSAWQVTQKHRSQRNWGLRKALAWDL